MAIGSYWIHKKVFTLSGHQCDGLRSIRNGVIKSVNHLPATQKRGMLCIPLLFLLFSDKYCIADRISIRIVQLKCIPAQIFQISVHRFIA